VLINTECFYDSAGNVVNGGSNVSEITYDSTTQMLSVDSSFVSSSTQLSKKINFVLVYEFYPRTSALKKICSTQGSFITKKGVPTSLTASLN